MVQPPRQLTVTGPSGSTDVAVSPQLFSPSEGPGGDGYLSVVTPSSPIGKAVLGRRAGDTVEVVVKGEPLEWAITFVD